MRGRQTICILFIEDETLHINQKYCFGWSNPPKEVFCMIRQTEKIQGSLPCQLGMFNLNAVDDFSVDNVFIPILKNQKRTPLFFKFMTCTNLGLKKMMWCD